MGQEVSYNTFENKNRKTCTMKKGSGRLREVMITNYERLPLQEGYD